jgi:uncharacterized membrane protein YraQ (UPF0718 family)
MPADLEAIASIFLDQAGTLWPFYLGGVLVAAVVKTFQLDRRIRASLVRIPRLSILAGTCAGVVSPLCSCGILPVVLGLSAAGVPLPPVLALLLSSPLMSPDSFLITAGQLGWTYALWKLAVAVVAGLVAGFASHALQQRGFLGGNPAGTEGAAGGGTVHPSYEKIMNAGCYSHGNASVEAADRGSRFVVFLDRFRGMAWLVGKYLAAALVVSAAATYYLPADSLEPLLGRRSYLSPLMATLISIPLPLPQVAAPSVIKGLLSAGMSPGAAMAMLIGGPVTSLPAISALLAVYHRRVLALYMGIGVGAALAAGVLFQSVYG